VAVSEEKLSELDEALADLGKDDDEVSSILRRFEGGQRTDLAAMDSELDALGDGADIAPPQNPEIVQDEWESENTEIEIIDSADDFILLVDEDDLEVLEMVADDVPRVTVPPPLPGQKRAQNEEEEGDEEDEGFFKKLFGSRRSSNRPS
jgi:hypothetical protein